MYIAYLLFVIKLLVCMCVKYLPTYLPTEIISEKFPKLPATLKRHCKKSYSKNTKSVHVDLKNRTKWYGGTQNVGK